MRSSGIVAPNNVHDRILNLRWSTRYRAVSRSKGQTCWHARFDFPRGDFTTGDGGKRRRHDGVVHQREVVRSVGEHRGFMQHRDVHVDHAGATAVVGPNGEHRGGQALCRHTPYRSVARLKGQAGWQVGKDGPRNDVTRAGECSVQRQITARRVVVKRQVRRGIGEGWHLVNHGEVEGSRCRATAVVGPDGVFGRGPQLRRYAPQRSVVRSEEDPGW